LLRSGTLVDATIIDAPSSTKNKSRARDPEMSFSLNNCHLIDFVLNKTIFSRRGLQAFV
jgi:hypothetical protein